MQSADTIIYSFQPSFHWDELQEAILPGRQARVQVTKTSPVTTTDSNEWKINTNLWESKTISLYYSRGNIFQRSNSIRIPRATAVPTSPSKLRALLEENTWLQHHLFLSEYYQGSERSEHGDNNKLSLNLHTAAEEDCILPLGFLGIRQSKAGRPFAPTVPSLTWRGPHWRRNRDYKVPLFTGNQGLGNNCLN